MQERAGAGAQDAGGIGVRIEFDEEVLIAGVASEIALEVGAGGGGMVDDQVKAEVKIAGELVDIGPIAAGGVDAAVINNGEAIIGRIGEEGQQVDDADEVLESATAEVGEALDRRDVGLAEVVGIGDEHNVAFGEVLSLGGWGMGGMSGEQCLEPRRELGRGLGAVELLEFIQGFLGKHNRGSVSVGGQVRKGKLEGGKGQ